MQVEGSGNSTEVFASMCCADPDALALLRCTRARNSMFPSVRLASEDESARTSERRFWVTDKGLFSSFPFQIIEDFTFL